MLPLSFFRGPDSFLFPFDPDFFYSNRYDQTSTVGNVPARYGHAMANFGFDNNWIVMFGGRNGTSLDYGSNEKTKLFGDTWLLSSPTLAIGGSWSTLGWSTGKIVSAPEPRWKHAMASLGLGLEQNAPKVVMFGGCRDIECKNLLADTWVLTARQNGGGGKNNQLQSPPIWSKINMKSFPSKRRSHAMAFLGMSSGNKALLFGGACGTGLHPENIQLCNKKDGLTWEFNGTVWTQPMVITSTELSPRYDTTMAALPVAASSSASLVGGFTLVMLGGKDKNSHEIKGS